MRRCYRSVALVLGGVLVTSNTSFNSSSIGFLTTYAAEEMLTEEMGTAFQEEVQAGVENVETEIPTDKTTLLPLNVQTVEKMIIEESVEEKALEEEPVEEEVNEEIIEEEPVEEETMEEESEQTTDNGLGLDEQEYQILLKIVEAEAGGEDEVGKMLVANVVMNRVRSSHFPNTIKDVVYQCNNGTAQFSPTADGRIDQVSISQQTVDAVARALNGEDASSGALYFKSVNSKTKWFDRTLNRVMQHGNHIFYTM